MSLIRSIRSKKLPREGCALTIGNFDAMHIGHQRILDHLVERGNALSLPSIIMTFDPTPEEYFRKNQVSTRLNSIGNRFFLLKKHHMDCILVIKFNKSFAETSADSFVNDYLIDGLNVKYLLIGDDFQFGKGRKGNFTMLFDRAKRFGFEVEKYNTVRYKNQRVSSTYVKQLLTEGNFKKTQIMLDRPYGFIGRVLHGDKRGRQLGFPTLNVQVKHQSIIQGVFIVSVKGIDDNLLYGVANLGMCPTVGRCTRLLEIHVFNFSKDVYGERICVDFLKKIRDEKIFDSFQDLKNQIFHDIATAKNYLSHHINVSH